MKGYTVLVADPCSTVSMETFNGKIQDLLNQGWQPFKGPQISGTGRGGQSFGNGDMRVVQAMRLE